MKKETNKVRSLSVNRMCLYMNLYSDNKINGNMCCRDLCKKEIIWNSSGGITHEL